MLHVSLDNEDRDFYKDLPVFLRGHVTARTCSTHSFTLHWLWAHLTYTEICRKWPVSFSLCLSLCILTSFLTTGGVHHHDHFSNNTVDKTQPW